MKVNCAHCGNELERKSSRVKKSKTGLFFCDRTCKQAEQRIGGKLQPEHYGTRKILYCKKCGKELINSQTKYCSYNCQHEHHYEKKIKKWLSGEWDGSTCNKIVEASSHVRRYVIERDKHQCVICGQGEIWNDKPLVLEIDHIDGDHKNNRPENLRTVCRHYHSQTDTFCGKNTGNGRYYCKERYRSLK
jgi:hypothetical protein